MFQVILFITMVIIGSAQSWGACSYDSGGYSPYSGNSSVLCKGDPSWGANMQLCSSTPYCQGGIVQNSGFYYTDCWVNYSGSSLCNNGSWGTVYAEYRDVRCHNRCSSQCEVDSIVCVNGGVGNWNSDSCKCVQCTQNDTTFTEISCAYDAARGQYLNIANKVTITNCEATVEENQYYSASCDSTCNDQSDLTCLGSVDGVTVFLRSCNGKVSRCEADGSCDAAIRKVASGECENPNSPPNGNNSSSSSEQGSSSSGGNVADSLGWLKDSLRVLHITDSAGFADVNHNLENIQPFVAGTYDQVTDIAGTVHDINSNLLTGFEFLNDIKENTGNTANNTNNINTKLNNTNSLLESLNQKNWHTTVNVSPPEVTVQGDTNIINVSGDTAKSGFEILNFLKRMFGSDTSNNYNPNDTVGFGARLSGLMDGLDSAKVLGDLESINGDSVNTMGDRMRGSYRAIMDSIGNSAINDSMNRWSEAITDNGVITGNGSDNCPDILTQTFDVNFPIGGTVSIGPLGVYLCRPVAGLNITFWALCRVILRAMVAIFSMIWLYKTVLGIDGGSSDDED